MWKIWKKHLALDFNLGLWDHLGTNEWFKDLSLSLFLYFLFILSVILPFTQANAAFKNHCILVANIYLFSQQINSKVMNGSC